MKLRVDTETTVERILVEHGLPTAESASAAATVARRSGRILSLEPTMEMHAAQGPFDGDGVYAAARTSQVAGWTLAAVALAVALGASVASAVAVVMLRPAA